MPYRVGIQLNTVTACQELMLIVITYLPVISKICIRGRPELASFSKEYTGVRWGGEGVNGHCTLFKMLKKCIPFSYVVVKNQLFKSTLLGGRKGGHKKSNMCTLLIMLTIMDDT